MRNSNPLVSVLMTVYNREALIAEAIESVLTCNYENLELIIVDDCSQDGSLKVARRFEQQDSRVRVFVNSKNLSDYPNRNKAASYAKGVYLKYLDSDDVLYPYGLNIMVDRMEDHPSAALGLAKRGLKEEPFPVLLSPAESYTTSFLKGNFLFGNAPTSVIIRRSVFESTGGFSGLNQLGDAEYWMKVAAEYPILLIEGDVSWNRDHPASEKYKDDVYAKVNLKYSLIKTALQHPNCPLNEEERMVALGLLEADHKKFHRKHRILKLYKSIFKV